MQAAAVAEQILRECPGRLRGHLEGGGSGRIMRKLKKWFEKSFSALLFFTEAVKILLTVHFF